MVLESLEAQDIPVEDPKKQRINDDDNEDDGDEEYSPLSDLEGEKLYHIA
jgi:hypothetical protein